VFEHVVDQNITHGWMNLSRNRVGTGKFHFDFIRRIDGVVPLECNQKTTGGVHFQRSTRYFHVASGTANRSRSSNIQALRLALWIYGLPQALFKGGGAFKTCIRNANEVLDCERSTPSKRNFVRCAR
jgi:hypothetical protein